jgi:hypothetical protein
VTGLLLPAVALATWRPLRRIDVQAKVEDVKLQRLRATALFEGLKEPALEALAARVRTVTAHAGEDIVRQGSKGQLFYVIGSGDVDVTVDGRYVGTQGPGEHFGEIGLLREVPRTATVTAKPQSSSKSSTATTSSLPSPGTPPPRRPPTW